MSTNLHINGVIAATHYNAEFISIASEDLDGTHCQNPTFYQNAIDNKAEFNFQHLPTPEFDVPWFDGFVFFHEGIAYVVSEELDSYTKIKNHQGDLNSIEQLIELIKTTNEILNAGYQIGFSEGRRDKALEIKKALAVD